MNAKDKKNATQNERDAMDREMIDRLYREAGVTPIRYSRAAIKKMRRPTR